MKRIPPAGEDPSFRSGLRLRLLPVFSFWVYDCGYFGYSQCRRAAR